MIKYNVVCIGTLKEKYLKDACAEYLKRLSRFSSTKIVELKEGRNLEEEATEVLKYLSGFVILLDIGGKNFSSEDFAEKLAEIKLNHSEITFVIGSSCGVSDSVRDKANIRLSFSKLTFPHQLFRVMLLEQIYRCECICANIAYHK